MLFTKPNDLFEIVVADNVLELDILDGLINLVSKDYAEGKFTPSGYKKNPGFEDYRKSAVLYQFEPYNKLIINLVHQHIPMVYELFNMPNIKYNSDLTEAQLTHHGNGDYYKIHNDNGDEPMGLRYLTYVYYFYKEPKAFSNGELRLYRMPLNNKTTIDASNSYIDIEPLSNRLVIFPSHFMHEVRVVNSNPTFSLSDRFTVNGWLHRTKL